MNSLMKHCWLLRIALIFGVSLVRDCHHRLLVADQGGYEHKNDLLLHQ